MGNIGNAHLNQRFPDAILQHRAVEQVIKLEAREHKQGVPWARNDSERELGQVLSVQIDLQAGKF